MWKLFWDINCCFRYWYLELIEILSIWLISSTSSCCGAQGAYRCSAVQEARVSDSLRWPILDPPILATGCQSACGAAQVGWERLVWWCPDPEIALGSIKRVSWVPKLEAHWIHQTSSNHRLEPWSLPRPVFSEWFQDLWHSQSLKNADFIEMVQTYILEQKWPELSILWYHLGTSLV